MEIEKNIKITYRWWIENKDIPYPHLQELESHAENKIPEMRQEGYSSGQLIYEIEGI